MRSELEEVRDLAEEDLYTFARLINPRREYGELHKRVFRWLQHSTTPNQLLLLPRSHMKSHCIAVWCCWWITKHPDTSIVYLSATTTLAEAQLYDIKNMLTHPIYTRYWPEMLQREEGKREKWSAGEIAVDHPLRKEEGVRDFTVQAAGLTTTTTGLHCEVLVADDVVVPDNAYTEEGRRKVAAGMSQMASILNTGGITKACGTRYHPADQYSIFMEQTVPVYSDEDVVIGEEPIWEIMEEVVEVDGAFIWPRTARADGKLFGFNRKELARISAMYSDRTQFYAQYYNDPNDPESNRLDTTRFQYYDKKHLQLKNGKWWVGDDRLNISAAIDFAFSLSKKADYTTLAVVGVTSTYNYYILDLHRFKSDKINDYYLAVEDMHRKWEFPRLQSEVNVAQSVISRDLKDRFREAGSRLVIDEHRPMKGDGKKEERIAAVLEPKYENLQMWHYKGGYTPALEDELMLSRPAHDDLKDALAVAVGALRPPKNYTQQKAAPDTKLFHSRFGGTRFR